MIRKGSIQPGDVFGNLTIISELEQLTRGHCKEWLCRCSCGTERRISQNRLREGWTDCGCIRKANGLFSGYSQGRLTLLSIHHKGDKYTFWNCRCECGKEKVIRSCALLSGQISCGCFAIEQTRINKTTHGLSKLPEYHTWANMLYRCRGSKPGTSLYEKYRKKGIQVHPEFLTFEGFYKHIGPMSGPEYSVDRIDGTKDYEPGNVRWATDVVQNMNRSSVKRYEYSGEQLTVRQIAEATGLSINLIRMRLKSGKSINEAISKPSQYKSRKNRNNVSSNSIG